jgi:hypothetical protein
MGDVLHTVWPQFEVDCFFLAENSVTEATQEVAEALGGDVKQTESELLNEMLPPSQAVKENENEAQEPSVSLR